MHANDLHLGMSSNACIAIDLLMGKNPGFRVKHLFQLLFLDYVFDFPFSWWLCVHDYMSVWFEPFN